MTKKEICKKLFDDLGTVFAEVLLIKNKPNTTDDLLKIMSKMLYEKGWRKNEITV